MTTTVSSRVCYAFDCGRPGVYDDATEGYFCEAFHLDVNPRSIRREMVWRTKVARGLDAPVTDGEPDLAADDRPRVVGAVDKLWTIFATMSDKPKPEVIAHCVGLGFKLNTAKTQYYYWKTGRKGGKKPGSTTSSHKGRARSPRRGANAGP